MKVGLDKMRGKVESNFCWSRFGFHHQSSDRGTKTVKLGDTLVEVILAIAIFSLVAVAAVAVISSSSSSAQAALEITTTREAIDEQVELLRYIHNSMLVGTRSDIKNYEKYRELWKKIVEKANNYNDVKDFVNNYGSKNSCDEIYGELSGVKAFILNPRQIYLGDYKGNGTTDEWSKLTDSEKIGVANNIIIGYNNSIFQSATTSPRLIYGSIPADDFTESLYDMSGTTDQKNLARAEGIFIIAVRDNGSTTLVDGSSVTTTGSAFYDFYVRSCWFEPSAERPSTISTLIRLVDPTTVGT